MAEIRRTAVVKLAVDDSDVSLLHETIDQYLWACNYVIEDAWQDDYKPTSKTEIHERTYDAVREQTELHSSLVQTARDKACEAIKGVIARWKNGETASQPHFTTPSVRYNKRCATFNDDNVSLATVDGRVTAEYILSPEGDNPQTEYLRSDEYTITGATLQYAEQADEFYLHIGTKKTDVNKIPENDTENRTVLGVDCGIENIAVTSTGHFWSGGYLNHRRDEYERIRGEIQQTGTESAHRTLQSMGDRESEWVDDYLHRISKAIVQEALVHECDTIVFEDLTGIRDRMPNAKQFHAWAFKKLFDYVEYKAKERGIVVVQVDPHYTSQTCSKCGETHRNSRQTQAAFNCQSCGYEVHADYNAAKNIGMKYLHTGQKSPCGGATRHLALKSGTLNVTSD